jgi:hypothetical protein
MKWLLIRSSTGEPDVLHDADDRSWGFSLLRELAKDPASGIHEIGPGVYVGASENTGRPSDR